MADNAAGELPHFATYLIMVCGKAFINAGFLPAQVEPYRVVYRRDRLVFSAAWNGRTRTLTVHFGHRREATGAVGRVAIGTTYNALLEAAGFNERLQEQVPAGDDVQAALRESLALIATTLPKLAPMVRELEPKARTVMRRSVLDLAIE